VLILDSGGFSKLSEQSSMSLALIRSFKSAGLWPPVLPTVVMVESLQGHPGRDANENRFAKTCSIEPDVSETLARRSAELRRRAKRGSAVDAIVVAMAEPGGTVLTGDEEDIKSLVAHAKTVSIELV
jgi:hypothetical protein